MAFDGFVTKGIVSELKQTIIGSKVNKILEPNKNEIIISLYNNGLAYALDLCINPELCRICLTTHSKPNPVVALNFCMLLRKYLTNAKLVNISSLDLERTVEIKFECYNELNDLVIRKLFIEIMSRQSNIILTDENNMIIDTLKHVDTSRDLLPAHEYTFVPITKKSFLKTSKEDFICNLNAQDIAYSLLSTYIGFSKTFISETLKILNIDNENYTNDDVERLYDYIFNVVHSFNTNTLCCKKINEKDYSVFLYSKQTNLDMNFFIDDFYFEKETSTSFISKRTELLGVSLNLLKKVSSKINNMNLKLAECENMDTYKLYGELLTANLYKLNTNENLSQITLENYYDNYSPITFKLDNTISVKSNIDKFYKKYNKLKNTLVIVSKQKLEAEKELDYIESIVFSIQNAKDIKDLTEISNEISENIPIKKQNSKKIKKVVLKSNQEVNLTEIKFQNYTIYFGKNNVQNEYLSLKFANRNDIWLHAQKIHGSHVLIRNETNLELEEIPEDVLYFAGKIAKGNSKAKDSLNVSIDYCLAKFVKKAPNQKTGMVNYTNFKTIII